jgi:ABC-type phosphate/phosphonate transport system substrate-binding protein
VIANARMYAVAPGAAAAWRRLFEAVSRRSGVRLRIIDHAYPAPLDELWARDDLAAAFICGLPFAKSSRRLVPIAAPIPADPRSGGRPLYRTDLVVHAASPIRSLADSFGGSVGYTAAASHSGYNALRYHLLRYRTAGRQRLYRDIVGPLVTPRRALEAVVAGGVDVAPLDSYALDLLRRYEPALAAQIRVVESTDAAPIPLLVGAPSLDPAIADRLAGAFAALPAGEPLLEALALAGFVRPDPAAYAMLAALERAAIAAGYPEIA